MSKFATKQNGADCPVNGNPHAGGGYEPATE